MTDLPNLNNHPHVFMDLVDTGKCKSFFTDADREAMRQAFTGWTRLEVRGDKALCEITADVEIEVSLPIVEVTCLRLDGLPADLIQKLREWHRDEKDTAKFSSPIPVNLADVVIEGPGFTEPWYE